MKSSKINRQNYEAYVIDYLDGALNPVETAELLLFLEINPDLGEEVEDLRAMVADNTSQTTYPFKDALKVAHDPDANFITEENHNHYFIAFHEGDLSEKGQNNVNSFLKTHPKLNGSFKLYALSKVTANPEISYPNHNELKKAVPFVRSRFIYYAAFAASLLLLIAIFIRLLPENKEQIINTIGGNEISELQVTKHAPNNESLIRDNGDSPIAENTPGKEPAPAIQSENTTKPQTGRRPSLTPMPVMLSGLHETTPVTLHQRTQFSDIYEYIHFSQEMLLADAELTPEQENANGDGRVFQGSRRLPGLIMGSAQIIKQVPEEFSIWMLADIGISGFNKLTDNDFKLEREINESGKTEKVRLLDGEMAYSFRRNAN